MNFSEKFNMLAEGEQVQIVTDSIRFIKSLNSHFGSETGIEVWNHISNTFGSSFQMEVLQRIFVDVPDSVTVFFPVRGNNFINAIKTVRALNPVFGLKDAKDFVEAAERMPIKLTYNTEFDRSVVVSELKKVGFHIS